MLCIERSSIYILILVAISILNKSICFVVNPCIKTIRNFKTTTSYNRLFDNSNEEIDWDPYSAPKLDFNECYYQVLEVELYSSASTIKKGFYKMVSKYHPDRLVYLL